MIEKLSLKNFKSFRNADSISLAPITLLSGQNSSGKSTLIQSLLLFKQTLESPVADEPIILNGSYVTLGDFYDVINTSGEDQKISFGITINYKRTRKGLENEAVRTGYFNYFVSNLTKVGFDIQITHPDYDFEENSLYIPKLLKSSIEGIYQGKKFETVFNYSELLKDRLKDQYNINNEQFLDSRPIFAIEKSSKLDWKPAAVLLNTFLPELVLKPFHKELEKQQDQILDEFFNSLLKALDYQSPQQVALRRLGKWEAHMRILTRKRSTLKADNSDDREKDIDFIFNALENILNEKSDIRDFNQVRTLTSHLKIIDTSVFKELLEILRIGLQNVEEVKKLKKSLKLNSVRDLHYQLDEENIDLQDVNVSIRHIFNNIYYLGPLREEPKAFYRRSGSTDPMYVGQKGENVAFVLKYYSKRRIPVVLPPTDDEKFWDPTKTEIVQTTLGEAVEKWLKYLGVANQIRVEEMGKVGLNIRANIYGDKESDLTNVGVGVSQVLPLIVLGLSAPVSAVLLFEQPELHLHPYIQSRLGDFFISLQLLGKQVIAETHSEHLIHRMRLYIAKGSIKYSDDVAVYFCQRNNEQNQSEVIPVNIDEYGNINFWPEGFFDETSKQLDDILMAAFEREGI